MSGSRSILLKVTAGLFVSLTLFVACSDRPKEVLSEKEMISLMADMQLAEAYSDIEFSSSNLIEKKKELAESVLKQHDVSQEQLDSTLSWYGRNIDKYTDLYEKVDVEIKKRRNKMLNISTSSQDEQEGDMLWPYSKNGMINALGNSDAFIVSIPEPTLQKGDMILWSMHLNSPAPFTGVLGVDYQDGSSESVTNVFSSNTSLKLRFQTDSSKIVKRIFGTLRVRDRERKAIFADSISLRRMPFDSIEFNKYRNQKKYGIPSRRKFVPSQASDTLSTLMEETPDTMPAPRPRPIGSSRVDNGQNRPDPNAPVKMMKLSVDDGPAGQPAPIKRRDAKPVRRKDK